MPSPVAPPTSQSSRRDAPLPQPISMTCLPAIAPFSAASRASRLANALKMPEKCWDSSKLVEYPITASSKMWLNRKPQESQQASSKSLRDKARAASAVSRRMQLWIGIDGTRYSIRATAAEHEGQTLRVSAPEGLPEVANYDPEVEALRPVSQAQKISDPGLRGNRVKFPTCHRAVPSRHPRISSRPDTSTNLREAFKPEKFPNSGPAQPS